MRTWPAFVRRARCWKSGSAVCVAVATGREVNRPPRAFRPPSPLLHAALNLAARLAKPPRIERPPAGPPVVSAEQGKRVEFGLTDQVLEQAGTLIGSADKLLDGELR